MNICDRIAQKHSKSPWKKLSSERVYDNPWISVDEDQVITPTGTKGIYGRVHMKNLAVGIIPIDTEGNTWLVGQFRYTLNEYSWEIPMGGCPEGEKPEETAIRELQEETGLIAKSVREIKKIHTSNSVTDEFGIVYIAEDLEMGETAPEETEDIITVKLPLREAVQMAFDSKITDSISVAGLLKIGILKQILPNCN